MDARPTYLADIVHRDALYLGYCNAPGMGVGGVWIEPNKDRVNRV